MEKFGGFGYIVEVDEALLGKKPTYATNTGQINSVFKI